MLLQRGRAMLRICQYLAFIASILQYLERSFFYYSLLQLQIYQYVQFESVLLSLA